MSSATVQQNIPDGLLNDDFDAVQYLDNILPTLNLSSKGSTAKQSRTVQLQSAYSETQDVLTKFNTYNIRTSSELTSVTDEMLRSGNRLAYEVEVLRSDASSLFDLLSTTLQDDIRQFVYDEIGNDESTESTGITDGEIFKSGSEGSGDPEFMQQLRALGHVKSRLEQVIRIFGEALKWPIPPSDVSVASSLISVSAPELGVANSAEDDKARATIRQYREEISDLLDSEGGGQAGLNAAQKRVVSFQDLAVVWKGTAEEKARMRVVDGFAKIVEDRRRALGSSSQTTKSQFDRLRPGGQQSRPGTPSTTAGGLWRKLRDEIS